MNIVAVVSQKGGTGKSTVSTNIAVAARERGLRTLVCDTDPQGSTIEWRKARPIEEPMVLGAKSGAVHPMRFAAERSGVELMIIDTQAASVACAVEAAKIADLTLIVSRPSPVDLRATAATVAALRPLRRPCAFVINQAPCPRGGREPVLINEAVKLLLAYGLPLAPVALRSRVIFQHAYGLGLSVSELAPSSEAAGEVSRLWAYVATRLAEPPHAPAAAAHRLPTSLAFLPRDPGHLHQAPAN